MKRILQDRKTLYLVLAIAMVSIFTLSIAYAAMSAVLEIHGNSEVVASNWEVYFDSPVENVGGANYDWIPGSKSKTLSFNVTLNNPGDKLKFTVDVVNGGSIDAMIDSVVKTPELTSEQAKYIKYEITYVDGTSISESQYLAVGSRKKVQVEVAYRNDISVNDLPTSATTLNLSIKLICSQASGNNGNINNQNVVNVVSGDGTQVGNEVCIKNECFYVISSTDTTVAMLSKYNLHVGNSSDPDGKSTPLTNPTGIQDKTAKGFDWDNESGAEIFPFIGTTAFSSASQKGTNCSDYSGSIVEGYVNNYNSYLITQGVTPIETRLITKDELISLGCSEDDYSCSSAPSWVYVTSYWSGSTLPSYVWSVYNTSIFCDSFSDNDDNFGVRPVITISRDYL